MTQGRAPNRRRFVWAALVAAAAVAGCGPRAQEDAVPEAERAIATMRLTSEAFADGEPIPTEFTCDGLDTSPPLAWEKPPAMQVESYVVIAEDPDAPGGTFTHWVLFNISPSLTGLPAGLSRELTLPRLGATHGHNDFGTIGYGGPCPPKDQTHHYRFHLYALDTRIALGPNVTRAAVEQAMRGHVVAAGLLTGMYRH